MAVNAGQGQTVIRAGASPSKGRLLDLHAIITQGLYRLSREKQSSLLAWNINY